MTILSAKPTIVLDSSKIDTFETCQFKYFARYLKNKSVPLVEKASALDIGGLMHSGLEVYFKGLAEGIHFNDRMEATLMKIREAASDPNHSNSDPDEVNELLIAVEQSCDYWRAEDENCLEILVVEEPFMYVLYEDEHVRIIISGKIDLLVNFHGLGRNASYDKLPIDHKSFRRDSEVLRKSNQFINYCAAVGSNYLVVNRIGLGYKVDGKKVKPTEEKFKRLPLSYDPVYIQEWKDNLTRTILNQYLTCVATGDWAETPTSCNKFNRKCEYYDKICDASLTKEEKIKRLEEDFADAEEWDVTKGLGEND